MTKTAGSVAFQMEPTISDGRSLSFAQIRSEVRNAIAPLKLPRSVIVCEPLRRNGIAPYVPPQVCRARVSRAIWTVRRH
jgi:hypothetical protein